MVVDERRGRLAERQPLGHEERGQLHPGGQPWRGVRIEPTVNILDADRAVVEDIWTFRDCYITDNTIAVEHLLGYFNPGYYSEVTLDNCRLEGSDVQAIHVYGGTSTDGVRTWGVHGVLAVMYNVDGCRIKTAPWCSTSRAPATGAAPTGSRRWASSSRTTSWTREEDTYFQPGRGRPSASTSRPSPT